MTVLVALATLLSLFTPPTAWKAATPAPSADKVITETYGEVVAQYATPSGGTVQVRTAKCAKAEDCKAFAAVASNISAAAACYCRGKCGGPKVDCKEPASDDGREWGQDAGGWARDAKAFGGDVLEVMTVDRARDENKLYTFVYRGPTADGAEFVRATEPLKKSANKPFGGR